jgi:hypothetical protein
MSLGDAWEKLGAPFLIGCFGMMILCAIAGYFGIQIFWRYHVLNAWEKRKTRRREALGKVFEAMPGEPEPMPEEQKTSLIASLEAAWKNIGKPLLANGLEIIVLCGNAGRDGIQTFWSHATAAWEQHKIEKQEALQPAAESVSGESAPAPEEQPATLLTTLDAAWINRGKPLLLEGFKMLQIFVSAGDAGIRTFWRHAVKALEQRKAKQQETQAENFESIVEESKMETNNPQQPPQE